MAEITKLSRLITGASRNISFATNTLVVDNLKLKLGGTGSASFSGTMTSDYTISVPNENVNLSNINSLNTLTGVTQGSVNLGTFTGSVIQNNRTIKAALQDLESFVESSSSSNFSDINFSIYDDIDPTKRILFQAAGIATGEARTISMPDSDVDLGLISDHETRLTAAEVSIEDHETRIAVIEDVTSYKKQSIFISNSIYEDGARGAADQSGDFRDGWYFKNDSINEFINWIFFSNPSSTFELGNFSAYAVITLDSLVSTPYFALFTEPTGFGDVNPAYHSKAVYTMAMLPPASDKCLVYIGAKPGIYPELQKIQLSFNAGSSQGDCAVNEQVIKASLSSDIDMVSGNLEFAVDKLGLNLVGNKIDFSLRIKELHEREKIQATAPSQLTYIDLLKQVIQNSMIVSIDRLLLHEDSDYEISTVDGGSGPVTRITWLGSVAAGGTSALQLGDNIQIIYRYNA
jgi:hypothetical protein